MTPPERLQDVTLAERLLALQARLDAKLGAGFIDDIPGDELSAIYEAAAALSVRGDGWVAVADDNRWKAMRKAVAAAKRPDADWYRRNIERDGDTDAMAGPSPTIGQQAVDDAELAEFVRGIYRRMNESYEGGRRILFQDMDYLFDFATKRRIILSQVRAALAAHGKPNA